MGRILTDGMEFGSGGASSNITVVANYSALPDPTTVAGEFYWASASQGTQWLPLSLGGTYYNSGLYYSNGVTWEYSETPSNATQAVVNTGTNTTQFVTPATLSNYARWNNIYNTPLMFGGAKNNNTTDTYLLTDGVFTNVVPIELPAAARIKSIVAASDGLDTWTAEIHNNGVLIVGASLSLTAESSKTVDNLNVLVGVGAKLSLYCNGTSVKRPRILVTLSNPII
jgi:hypothetical protein